MKASEKQRQMLKDFGEHITEIRKKKEIRVSVITRKTGIEMSNYRKIEQGDTNPTLVTLMKLAIAFDVTLEELMKGFKGRNDILEDI